MDRRHEKSSLVQRIEGDGRIDWFVVGGVGDRFVGRRCIVVVVVVEGVVIVVLVVVVEVVLVHAGSSEFARQVH